MNTIYKGLLCLSLAALSLVSLTSCHDSVEVPPATYSSSGKIFYSQIDFTNYRGDLYPLVTLDANGQTPHIIGQGIGMTAGGGKIMYLTMHVSGTDTTGNIDISNDDGTAPKTLLSIDSNYDAKPEWMPVISPDGSKVLYAFLSKSNSDMYDVTIQDVSTGKLTVIDQVMHGENVPGFSPDGKYVVYYSGYGSAGGVLKIASVDGSNIRTLTTVSDISYDYIARVTWRPGTQQIAYFDGGQTFIINSDGSGKRLLVSGVTPAWSPDGSKLVYAIGNDSVSADLYVTSDLGQTATNITNTTDSYEAYPVWSPDSKTIYALRWSGDYDHTMQSLISIDLATKTNKFVAAPAQFLFVTK